MSVFYVINIKILCKWLVVKYLYTRLLHGGYTTSNIFHQIAYNIKYIISDPLRFEV